MVFTKIVTGALVMFALCLGAPGFVRAQEDIAVPQEAAVQSPPPTIFERGQIVEIVDEGTHEEAGFTDAYQQLSVRITTGEDAGDVVAIENTTSVGLFASQRLDVGDRVVLTKMSDARGTAYYIVDSFRLPGMAIMIVAFFILSALLGRRHGVMATVGLVVSVLLLTFGVAPAIAKGVSPVLATSVGAVVIASASMLLAHTPTLRTWLALAATLLSLALAFALSWLAIHFGVLTGAGGDEVAVLQSIAENGLDLRGLLLAGMVIGALGVLDDVTTAQVAAVAEIQEAANGKLSAAELYRRGFVVGREHIASLINTLALAYVGASFPLFLLFMSAGGPPAWVVLNSESIAEEVIRALVGGAALMLAVPIATVLAAAAFAHDSEAAK